jgi:hypothetical protein
MSKRQLGILSLQITLTAALVAATALTVGVMRTALLVAGLLCLALLWQRLKHRKTEQEKKMASALRVAMQNGAMWNEQNAAPGEHLSADANRQPIASFASAEASD